MSTKGTARRPRPSRRVLRVLLQLDGLASTAMPVLLLAAVPVLAALDPPGRLVGFVVLGYAIVLGALGAVTAGTLGRALADGDSDAATPAVHELGHLRRPAGPLPP